MKRWFPVAVLALLLAAAAVLHPQFAGPRTTLHIVSGSENQALEPIVLDWGAANRVSVEITYLGSVDIARALSDDTGTEPLYAIYSASGLSEGDGAKETALLALQSYLLTDEVQDRLLDLGRRTGLIGVNNDSADIGFAALPETVSLVVPMPPAHVMETIIRSVE